MALSDISMFDLGESLGLGEDMRKHVHEEVVTTRTLHMKVPENIQEAFEELVLENAEVFKGYESLEFDGLLLEADELKVLVIRAIEEEESDALVEFMKNVAEVSRYMKVDRAWFHT
jgi:hypothetical protein